MITPLDSYALTAWSLLAALVVLALAGFALHRRHESTRLQRRFGSEYGRAVDHLGSREKAEAELQARERRVHTFHLVPLPHDEATRYAREWLQLQGRFVDDPSGTLIEADRLVRELMMQRGYPMADFEHRAADVSVDHADVVDHYRVAHAIAVRDHRGATDTEEVRQAVVHYRALFDELLEVAPEGRAKFRRHHVPFTRHQEARS